ncbi:MAG: glucose 1-dehydrogenase [Caldilineaceae bacterium]
MRLANQVALITGSTAGIGRACAERFAAEGATVILNDDGRQADWGEQTVAQICERGGKAAYIQADMAKSDEVRALIGQTVVRYGRLDILMNNAYSGRHAGVVEMAEADWDASYAVTVKAIAVACQCAIPAMRKGGGGSIINTASVQGLLASRRNAPYNTFKAAIINLTRQMAVDYGRDRIRVNALCPGRILTESKIEMLRRNPAEVRRQQLVYPLGRPGALHEIANAALFLASSESSYVTGHALVVDGGLTAQLQDAVGAYVDEMVSAEPPDTALTFRDGEISIRPPDPAAIEHALATGAVAADVASAVEGALAWGQSGERNTIYFSIYRAETLVGQLFLHDGDLLRREALIGYHLFQPGLRGQGIGTRALRLLLHYVLQCTIYEQLVIITDESNTASRRLAEKGGFVHTGYAREGAPLICYTWRRDKESSHDI